MKRSLVFFMAMTVAALVPPACGAAEARLEKLVLAGPVTVETYPMLRMIERDALSDVAKKTCFIPWRNPDQVRALIVGNKVDFTVVTTTMAANLYNRSAFIRLLDLSFPSSLWVLSSHRGLTSLEGLAGRTIAMPFRGDSPDILFALIARKAGFDLGKKATLRYAGTPMDAAQLLLLGQTDCAFLGEPAASMARLKSGSGSVPPLYRSIDMQQAWRRHGDTDFLLPLACTAVTSRAAQGGPVVARFRQEYRRSLGWCLDHPKEAGRLASRYFPVLKPEVAEEALRASAPTLENGTAGRPKLECFLGELKAHNPGVIGGRLPDTDFYWTRP